MEVCYADFLLTIFGTNFIFIFILIYFIWGIKIIRNKKINNFTTKLFFTF